MQNAPIIRDTTTGQYKELPANEKLRVTLSQLHDVDINNPQDGDVPQWNNTAQRFENAPASSLTPAQQFWIT